MIRTGRGVATVYYPSGFNGGGDPDVVSITIKTDGTLVVSNGSNEMGQGIKNIAIQFVAETLGIETTTLKFNNYDSDTTSFSMDTAGSRSTVIVGNACIAAANDFIAKFKAFAGNSFGVAADAMSYAEGTAFVTAEPDKKMTLVDLGAATNYSGNAIIGVGGYLPPPGGPRDPQTGATEHTRIMAYGSTVIDVEVDDETGVVNIKNLYNCYDVGTVVNPLQMEQQVDGGNIMGIGMALFEDLNPSYPDSMKYMSDSFTDYIIPTFMDAPDHSEIVFYENPDPDGPYGAKGCGEMVNDTQVPAIINAIYDAVGVIVDDLPATPERVLRLIKEKNA